MQPDTVSFARVGIGKLIMSVVRQRHVPSAQIIKLLHIREIGANRKTVLDADKITRLPSA